MEYQLLAPLLSLIESNKAHIDTNKKYLYHYIQDQRHELNKIMESLQKKKEITDQVITVLERVDTFDTNVNRALFVKAKEEIDGLHQTALDYFMHCYHVRFSTCDDNVTMSNSEEQSSDLQHAIKKELEEVKSRIQHLYNIMNEM